MADEEPTQTLLVRKQIGERIRSLRDARGLDVPAFAQLCGVAASTIVECESCQRRLSTSDMAKVATACGVSIAYFLVT